MIRNFLKTTLRGVRRHPAYALLNIGGLALGLFVSFMILMWVRDEMSYNDFHEDGERIMRVMRTTTNGGRISTSNSITAYLADVLDEDYPEIEMTSLIGWDWDLSFVRGDLAFRNDIRYAGPEIFQVLTFPFIAGNPETALDIPESIVLTEQMAQQYFPEIYAQFDNPAVAAQNVVGQTMRLENRLDVTVTGVAENIPRNSSIQWEAMLAFEEYRRNNSWVDGWNNNGFRMYAKLAQGADPDVVSEKIRNIVKDNSEASTSVLFLQPMSQMRLWTNWDNGVLVGGRIDYVRILSVVGMLILLIAAINFTNLATARSAQRAMEIGIRKTFGGSRKSLAAHFIGESMLTAVASLAVALVAVIAILPAFNALTDKAISLFSTDLVTWGWFVGLTLFTGFVAGAYPAAYLSGMGVIGVMRSQATAAGSGGMLRRVLVIFQYSISVLLIVGTITVYKQLDYIQNTNLGLDRENVFLTELEGGAREQYDAFKSQLLQSPAIVSVTTGWENPFDINSSTSDPDFDGKDPEDNTSYYVSGVGLDFLTTMGVELKSGRDWDAAIALDTANVIINEAAAATMPMDDPVGERWDMWGREGVVVGVVKNFHLRSLYEEIQPMALRLDEADGGSVFVRIAPGQTRAATELIEATYRQFSPGYPYAGKFMDDDYDAMYRSETVIGVLANWFAILAVVIACLGLYGLASFTTARRTKEVGVRKVLGASVPSVIMLLTREFVLLVGAAFVLASPVAWILMNNWLTDFKYHIELGAGIFVVAALGMMVITYATVGWHSFRAAVANPTDSLRSE